MSRTGLLLVALFAAGCGRSQPPAPTPEDSGAGTAPLDNLPVAKRAEGRGHPERLPAGRCRAVRGDKEVQVSFAGTFGDRFVVSITVLNRNKVVPFLFTGWDTPGQVKLRGDDGTEYPLLPAPAGRDRALSEDAARQPNLGYTYGAGPVTRDRGRVATLEFDPRAATAGHLDLDLAGGSVGFADPILFRIPRGMLTQAGLGAP